MVFLKNVGNSLNKKMLEIKSRHLTWGGPMYIGIQLDS